MIWNCRGHFRSLWLIFLLVGTETASAGSYEDFFKAVNQDDSSQVRRLLVRGFDANTADPSGQTGLHLALREPSLKSALVLIEWPRTDVNQLNAQGESALMLTAIKGQAELAAKLIGKKADVNKTGWTALHYAASAGHLDLISLLLENSAYIDAESPNRTTPLMMAARYGSVAAVKLLLDQDADPQLKNQQGLAALDFAQQGNRPDAAEIIASHLRKKQTPGKW